MSDGDGDATAQLLVEMGVVQTTARAVGALQACHNDLSSAVELLLADPTWGLQLDTDPAGDESSSVSGSSGVSGHELSLLLTGDCFPDTTVTVRVASAAELVAQVSELVSGLVPASSEQAKRTLESRPELEPLSDPAGGPDAASLQQLLDEPEPEPEPESAPEPAPAPAPERPSGEEHEAALSVPEAEPPPRPDPTLKQVHAIDLLCTLEKKYRQIFALRDQDTGQHEAVADNLNLRRLSTEGPVELYVHTSPTAAVPLRLITAISEHNLELFEQLLRPEHANSTTREGGDPLGPYGTTLLFHTIMTRSPRASVEELRPLEDQSHTPDTEFFRAANITAAMVRQLLAFGADPNRIGTAYNRYRRGIAASRPPPLLLACQKALLRVATHLLDASADPNKRRADNTPPLHFAVVSGSADCVDQLLQAGADVNFEVVHGGGRDSVTCTAVTPLFGRYFDADTTARCDIARLLLRAGCNAMHKPEAFIQMAHSAANAGRSEQLQEVLTVAGESRKDLVLQGQDQSGKNIMHCAAISGHNEIISYVSAEGFGDMLKQADSQSMLPVHYAALHGHSHVIFTIDQLGFADTFQLKNREGKTALEVALEHGHYDCLHACSADGKSICSLDHGTRIRGLRRWFMHLTDHVAGRHVPCKLVLDRDDLVLTTLQALGKASAEANGLRRPLKIEFCREAGADAGGLTRDFFTSIATALADASHGSLPPLFKLTPAGSLAPISPIILNAPDVRSPSSPREILAETDLATRMTLSAEMRARYVTVGRVAGMALLHGHKFGRPFACYFLRAVCNDSPETLEDLQQEFNAEESVEDEPDFRGSGAFLTRRLSAVGLEDTLTMTRTITSTNTDVELVAGGSTLTVTNSKKADWLRSSLHHKLVASIEQQAAAFREGLLDVVPADPLEWFSASELQELWGGHAISDEMLAEWQAATRIDGSVEQEARWFFTWLATQSQEKRADVLAFITGSSAVPTEGFTDRMANPMRIDRDENPRVVKGHLMPTAATCFNLLRLPPWSSQDAMCQALPVALEWGAGFGLA